MEAPERKGPPVQLWAENSAEHSPGHRCVLWERLPAACVPDRSGGCLDSGTSGAACQHLYLSQRPASGPRPMGPPDPACCAGGWELAGLTARHAGPVISKDSQTSGPESSLLWGAAPEPGAAGGTLTPLCTSLGEHGGPVWQRTEAQRERPPPRFNHKAVPGLRALLQTPIPPGSGQGTPRGTPRGSTGCG